MIDHKIVLQLLYQEALEKSAYLNGTQKERVTDSEFIFFPVIRQGYYEKLNKLKAIQYLQRLRLLYPILWRSN